MIVDSTITNISDSDSEPEDFRVHQNFPNPFGKSSVSGAENTTIVFELSKPEKVGMIVYNSIGERVQSFKKKEYSPGRRQFVLGAANLPSGIYFYVIETSESQIAKKIVLLK